MKPQTKHCTGKEVFERMNYLHQIGAFCAEQSNKPMISLSRHCSNLMTSIGKKAVLRIGPKIKRRICKLCKTVLISGKTCKVKVTKRKVRKVCNVCKRTKSFLTNRTYPCWIDNPESALETFDYSRNKIK